MSVLIKDFSRFIESYPGQIPRYYFSNGHDHLCTDTLQFTVH